MDTLLGLLIWIYIYSGMKGRTLHIYSAYKSHIYRKHSLELYSSRGNSNVDTIFDADQQEENKDLSVEIDETDDDNNCESFFNNEDLYSILSNIDCGTRLYDSVASFSSADIDEEP
ncbi:unnamed protein product, partial [Rotaria magnacalcarata]